MKKYIISSLLIVFFFAACKTVEENESTPLASTEAIGLNSYSTDSLLDKVDSNPFSQSVPIKNVIVPYADESFCPTIGTLIDTSLTQKLVIDAKSDTCITLKGGTKLFIPSYAFVDSAKVNVEEVILNVNEFLTPFQFLSAGLSTKTANGALLETGGTVYVEAKDTNGNNLKIDDDKYIQLAFAKPKNDSIAMQTYSGNVDQDGFVEWSLNELDVLRYDSIKVSKVLGTRYEQFENGDLALEEYFAGNLHLKPNPVPRLPIDNVFVNFDVAEKGKIQNIKVTGAEDPLLTNKIANVTRFMPQWKAFQTPTGEVHEGITEYRDITMGIGIQLTIDALHGKVILDSINSTQVRGMIKYTNVEEYYVIQSRQVGWINCDRIFNSPESFVTIRLPKVANPLEGHFLVARDFQAILRGTKESSDILFTGVPNRSFVYLISAKKKDGKFLAEIQPYIAGQGNAGDKVVAWYTEEELKSKLNSIWQTRIL